MSGKVSVIIPCYNYAHFLEQSVASILEQDYHNFDIIIVNDGSQDNSDQICQQLLKKFPDKIKYRSIPNSGVATARNTAIEISQADYILPLDADDLLLPGALRYLVKAIEADPKAGIAYGSVKMFDGLPGEPTQWITGYFHPRILPYQNCLPISSLWRKSLWEKGVKYREGFYEDWDLWLQIFSKGYTASYTPHFVFNYRQHHSGRDSKNKFFFYQALAQLSKFHPLLYDPSTVQWAEIINYNAPNCHKLPTLSFIFSDKSKQYRHLHGFHLELAREFIKRGYFVSATASYTREQMTEPGLLLLSSKSSSDAQSLCDHTIKKVGCDLILITDFDQNFQSKFRTCPNVTSIINLNQNDSKLADLSLSETESGFSLIANKSLVTDISAIADEIIKNHAQISKTKQNQQQELSKRCFKLSKIPDFTQVSDQATALTVAIPLRNVDAARLERCLSSIRQSTSEFNLRIILSDFGSDLEHFENVKNLAQKYKAELLAAKTSANWSRSRCLNIAIRHCKTDWILFTDVDMIFSSELFNMWNCYYNSLNELLGEKAVYLAQCKKLPPIAKLPLPWDSSFFEATSQLGRVFQTFGHGGCQIMSTKLLRELRGFNENFEVWGSEDLDLSNRAELNGCKIIWMHPGKYLHQWHIKSVPQNWRDTNAKVFEQELCTPRLIVNSDNWGTISNQEVLTSRQQSKSESNNVAVNLAKEIEKAVLSDKIDQKSQIKLLNDWVLHCIKNEQLESAQETIEDILTIEPQNIDALIALAQHQCILGGFGAASHYAKLLLELKPNCEKANIVLDVCMKG